MKYYEHDLSKEILERYIGYIGKVKVHIRSKQLQNPDIKPHIIIYLWLITGTKRQYIGYGGNTIFKYELGIFKLLEDGTIIAQSTTDADKFKNAQNFKEIMEKMPLNLNSQIINK